jgi:cytoskeletal protein RodZ
MEHLENDMDDLFQRAGEHYPLKTSGSDWDAVLGKLNEEGFGDQTAAYGINKRSTWNKRRWLLLLLLIPIGLGSVIYFSSSKKLAGSSTTNNIKSKSAGVSEESSNRSNDKSKSVKADKSSETTSKNSVIEKELLNSKSQEETPRASNTSTKVAGDPANGNTENLIKNGATRNKNATQLKTTSLSAAVSENTSALSSPEDPENYENSLTQTLAKKPLSLSVSESNDIITVKGKPLSTAASVPVNIVSPSTYAKTKINKGFYVGFIGGPDLSTVKLQSVEQLGYSLGAIVGYRINKKLSVETGLLWDKKYYYTEGKYFSKDQLYVPPSAYIVNVNGNCNMLEIPVSIRYDFASSTGHGFFISGGLSSYLMRQQNYTALVANSSSQWPAPFSSDSPSNYFFSIIQLSAGYEFAVSGKTKIRIEPYVKIPLQGIGIGNLPISSTGLYLGITHSFR